MSDRSITETRSRYSLEVIWIVAGQILSASGSIVGIRLLTNTLSPHIYGEVALALTIGALFTQVIYGPLAVASLRFYSAAVEKHQLLNYFRSVLRINYQIILILCPACLIGLGILYVSQHESLLSAFGFAAVLSILLGCNGILDGMQNAARRRAIVAIHQGVAQWLRFAGAALLATIFSATSSNAMIGFILASLIVLTSQSIVFYFSMCRQAQNEVSNPRLDCEWRTSILSYSWPFATFGIFCWIQMASDRWALQAFSNPGAVGLYAVVYQLGFAPAVLIHGIMVQLITPVYFARAGDGTNSARLNTANTIVKRLLLTTVVLTGLGFAACFLMHKFIFRILTPAAYHDVSFLLAPMFLAGGIFSAGQTLAIFHMGDKNTKALILPKIGTALAGTGFNIIGAYWFGVPGIVWATLVFSSFYFLWMYIASAQLISKSKASMSG